VEVVNPQDVTAYASFSGRTAARDFVEIRARVQGYLESAEFDAGAMVEKGQTLFEIDPKPFQAALNAAKAEVDGAKATLELAETTLARQKELFDKKAVSELDYLNAKAERDKANAALELAKAHVDNTQIDLSYTTVKSPIAGRASRREVSVGNLVGKGEATLLTSVVTLQPIEVYFEVDERQVVGFIQRRGGSDELREASNHAELTLTNGTRHGEIGKIDFIDNRVDPQTGTIKVRAIFPNEDGTILPGIFVRIRFPRDLEQSITVPQTALQRDLGGTYLLLADADNDASVRYVETSDIIGDRIVVTNGLSTGDRVIVSNLQRARPGSKVTVEEVEPPPPPQMGDPGKPVTPEASSSPSPSPASEDN